MDLEDLEDDELDFIFARPADSEEDDEQTELVFNIVSPEEAKALLADL
jgi:hypothetical protein